MTALLILLMWFVSCFLFIGIIIADSHYGTWQSYWNKYQYREALAFGLGMGLIGGPFALTIGFFLTGFAYYGVEWKYVKNN